LKTHLYFDSYRQRVELFIQFFEHNQLLQRETAEPVDTQREGKEKEGKEREEGGGRERMWNKLGFFFFSQEEMSATRLDGAEKQA
jgi:hypothetical protein